MTQSIDVKTAWDAVMNERRNPLRTYPLQTAHMIMQTLAWMWCAIFSVAVGSHVLFGVSIVGHVLVIAGVFTTLMVFRKAEAERHVAAG